MNAALVSELEDQVNALSKECFGLARLERGTEFHGKELLHGNGNFKGIGIEQRLDVLQRLAKVIERHNDLFKIYVGIDVSRLVASEYESKAFMFLVERIQSRLSQLDNMGMLIGDYEKARTNASIYELSRYREPGTSFQFGIPVDRLIDTVHFSQSHHSRMLQLADIYIYAQQLCALPESQSYPSRTFRAFVRTETRLLRPHNYKQWPTEQTWYR